MSTNPVDRSLLRLLLYYVLLVLGAVILARYVPAVHRAVSLEGPPPGMTAKSCCAPASMNALTASDATSTNPSESTIPIEYRVSKMARKRVFFFF